MIEAYGQHGQINKSIELFEQMQQHGIQPNIITFTSLLSSCGEVSNLNLGKQLHSKLIKSGIQLNINVQNTLISMYSKCGSLNDSISIFNEINDSHKDVITWTFND